MNGIQSHLPGRRVRLGGSLAWPGGLLAFVLITTAPDLAHAASPAAEALFEEGRRFLDQGRTDEACVKFAESLAQEASSGTLLNLAQCHEMQGKTATAWAEYRAAARFSRQQNRIDRAEAAEQRALALEPRLSRLKLVATQPPPDLRVQIDDEAEGEGALGLAVPIDPGTHRVRASAPGRRSWSATVLLESTQELTLEIPALEVEPAPPAVPPIVAAPIPAVAPRAVSPAIPGTHAKSHPAPESAHARARAGWIVGGAGVVGLGVGSFFGLSSLASYRAADRGCPSAHLLCSDAAIAERRKAESSAWVSNVALGLGLLATSAGAYLILSSGSNAQRAKLTLSVTSSAGGGWLGISRRF